MPPFDEVQGADQQYLTRKAQTDVDAGAAPEGKIERLDKPRRRRRRRAARRRRPRPAGRRSPDPQVTAQPARRPATPGFFAPCHSRWPHRGATLPVPTEPPRTAMADRRLPARARSASPTCRRSRACASRRRRPASATRAAPTCCCCCSTRARRSAGVFTRSKCPSAPGRLVPRGACRAARRAALVVNSGNANAFTGKTGADAVEADRRHRRQGARLHAASEVFLASTGVIGEPLDATKFEGVLRRLRRRAPPRAVDRAPRARS